MPLVLIVVCFSGEILSLFGEMGNNFHYNKGERRKFGDQCGFDHSKLATKAEIEAMEKPKAIREGRAQSNNH